MLTCPYDPTHRISEKRFQLHVIKCKKNYLDVQKEICPYNALHILEVNTLAEHISKCPDRGSLDSLLASSAAKNTNMNRGCLVVPSYRLHSPLPNQGESWSSDEDEQERNSPFSNLHYNAFDLKAAVDKCYQELMKTEKQNGVHTDKENSLMDNLLANNSQHDSKNKSTKIYQYIGLGRGGPLIQQQNSNFCYNRVLSSGFGTGNSTIGLLDGKTSPDSLNSDNESLKNSPLENNSQKETKKIENLQLLGIGRGIPCREQCLENNSSQISNHAYNQAPFLGIGRGFRLLQIASNSNKSSDSQVIASNSKEDSLNSSSSSLDNDSQVIASNSNKSLNSSSSSLENDSQKKARSGKSKNFPVVGFGRGISSTRCNINNKSTGLKQISSGHLIGIGRGRGLIFSN